MHSPLSFALEVRGSTLLCRRCRSIVPLKNQEDSMCFSKAFGLEMSQPCEDQSAFLNYRNSTKVEQPNKAVKCCIRSWITAEYNMRNRKKPNHFEVHILAVYMSNVKHSLFLKLSQKCSSSKTSLCFARW